MEKGFPVELYEKRINELESAIVEMFSFILKTKHQSIETDADKNCLLLNLEGICIKNFGYVPTKDNTSTNQKEQGDKNGNK